MAISAPSTGTQLTTIGTEHFLYNASAGGVYTMHVDTVNMASNAMIELRVYQMVLTGGTARVTYLDTGQGVPPTDDTIMVSVPISNELADAQSLRFSLKQTTGGSHNFPFKVIQHT